MPRMFVRLLAAGGVTVGVAIGIAGTAQAQGTGTATVTVVHGVPNTPVDVYVNSKLTLTDFQPETVSQALAVPAGKYTIAIRKHGTKSTATPIITGSATLSAGENATLVAYLNATGKPTLGAFQNDTTPIAQGDGRLIVRHTADAPAVDVLATGKVALSDLTSGNQATATLPAGSISAAVAAHGSTTPVIGPATVTLTAGTDTIVYAVGSLNTHTLALVTQTISGLGAGPSSVVTGNTPVGYHHVFPLALLAALLLLTATGGFFSLRALRRHGR